MKYAIITGSSKGLGESIARLFLESTINVIGISRSKNNQLSAIAKENNTIYKHIPADLGDIGLLDDICNEISKEVFSNDLSTIYLINNAATVEPVNQSRHIQLKDLASHVNLNIIAPMAFTNYFLQQVSEKEIELISAIITSGAAESPIYGWSAYCSTKASMNMYTKTVALEQKELETENKIIGFNPGIMDTEMQQQIRSNTEAEFLDVERFKGYKENNLLRDTEIIAGVLVDILTDDDVQSGKIYQVSDYI